MCFLIGSIISFTEIRFLSIALYRSSLSVAESLNFENINSAGVMSLNRLFFSGSNISSYVFMRSGSVFVLLRKIGHGYGKHSVLLHSVFSKLICRSKFISVLFTSNNFVVTELIAVRPSAHRNICFLPRA